MAPAAGKTQTRAQLRAQQRAERTLRAQENRQLRKLPAAQRAAKRQEINQQRQQRAQQKTQPNALNALQAQPNAAVRTNAQVRSGLRRNGQARVTRQAARAGRFAAPFAAARTQNANIANVRGLRVSSRQAWRQGRRASFTPWYGPVFWPYAYSDIFDYAFWPGGYDDGYFAYAYDDFFDGVFWGEEGPPAEYAYDEPGDVAGAAPARIARPSYAAVQALCKQPGSGVTAWPFAEITSKVGLNAEQKQLLDEVRNAAAKAAAAFKASCPTENAFPLTPPGRLGAMTARLDATLEAVQTVRPALETFYASLSDEQKERFNEIGPEAGDCRRDDGSSVRAGRQQLQGAEARPDQSSDRDDRGCDQADRRSGRRSGQAARGHRQGGLDPAGGLPGRDAAHPARPAGSDGDAAESHDRGRRHREAGAQ